MPYDESARARRVEEPGSKRSAFARDRARVLHSGALRRLAGKTQVVEPLTVQAIVPRTRLTHSLECSQIGRELGAALGCDPDLVDTACLAHDLGHPPFGHNGELALDEVAKGCGGFEGNAQSFRLLTRLEVKVEGAGLNLTRATLDAATKYPWLPDGRKKYGVYPDDADVFSWVRQGVTGEGRCLESQVMDWADDVAYSVHDLEDGVVAGLIDLSALDKAAVAELASTQFCDAPPDALLDAFRTLTNEPWWPANYDGTASAQAALKQCTSSLIARFCSAAEQATKDRYGAEPLSGYAADLLVPERERLECALLKAVTMRYVMGRPGATGIQEREREVITELVDRLTARAPEELEPHYREMWHAAGGDAARLRVVIDQVAALTDAAALGMHSRLA